MVTKETFVNQALAPKPLSPQAPKIQRPNNNQVEDTNPLKNRKKSLNSVHLYTFVSFPSKTL